MADVEKDLKENQPEELNKGKEPEVDHKEAEAPAESAETAESAEDVKEEDGKKKKKKFFQKAEAKPSEAEIKLAEMTDRVQRTMAEFDNFRKRTEKEKAAMYEVGAKGVLEKILPIVDSFERGLAGMTPEQKETDPFAAGMDMVYRQLLKALDELDVKKIDAVGQTFDPGKHNAVMHVEDEEAGENEVVEEFQKGYTYRNSVIRYSMVKVAN